MSTAPRLFDEVIDRTPEMPNSYVPTARGVLIRERTCCMRLAIFQGLVVHVVGPGANQGRSRSGSQADTFFGSGRTANYGPSSVHWTEILMRL
jgi:hypothetical protein